MISFYPQPKLMQMIPTVPNALFGIERLNAGYQGPSVRVRRSSDFTVLDCRTAADIIAFCTGTNGFAAIAYDQSSNSRDLGQTTLGSQAKIYDSVTGLLKFGSTFVMSFDGVDDFLYRNDNCGVPNGSPEITTVTLFGAWTNTGNAPWSIGPPTGGGGPFEDCWYAGRNASTTMFAASRGPSRTFNTTDPTTTPGYLVQQKGLNANATAWVLRQNKTVCTQNAVTAGIQNLAIGVTRLASNVLQGQFCQMTCALHAHFNALLAGAELNALEQYLERMRVQ